jgi:hypothetical protein
MEVRTNHLPMCTCPLGVTLQQQQVRPPWAHKSRGSEQYQSRLIIKLSKHVHKTPLSQTSAQRRYVILQARFGEGVRRPYSANSHWTWDVSR